MICTAPCMWMEIRRACAIVQSCMCVFVLYACARTWRRIANVSGAAAGMQTMRRIRGCGRCYRAWAWCGVQSWWWMNLRGFPSFKRKTSHLRLWRISVKKSIVSDVRVDNETTQSWTNFTIYSFSVDGNKRYSKSSKIQLTVSHKSGAKCWY